MHQTCCVLKISVENRKIYSYLRNISSNDIKHKYLLFCQITIFLSKVRVDFEKILQWLFKMLKMHFRTQCLQCAFVTFKATYMVMNITQCRIFIIFLSHIHVYFTWNQSWWFLRSKNCHFYTIRGSEFWFLWIITVFSKSSKFKSP